jgi:predicted CoA-binding protein
VKTIAVVGASASRHKFGNKCVRAYRDAGYQVYPVNPSERVIEGLPVFRTLDDVPAPLERISVYLPPPLTRAVLPAIARAVTAGSAGSAGSAAGTEVWFNPGSADAAVLAEARRLGIAARPGCSIIDIGRLPSEFPG